MSVFPDNEPARGKGDGKKALFCSYCGTRLDEGARFCKHCGEPVAGSHPAAQPPRRQETPDQSPTVRKTVYAGYLHKCPNCGEVLESFTAVCPACGCEIRNAGAASSVRELARKLEEISAQTMPAAEENRSLMKMVFGKDLRAETKEEDQKRFEQQKNEAKASLIINFSVPNTKEDLLEFMLMAASNINVKLGGDDNVTKAWINKMEQVYQRAKISMAGHPDFAQLKNIYMRKKAEIRNRNITIVLIVFVCVFGWLFLMGVRVNPLLTAVAAVAVFFVFFAIYRISGKRKSDE